MWRLSRTTMLLKNWIFGQVFGRFNLHKNNMLKNVSVITKQAS
jgi:hypothetical protein